MILDTVNCGKSPPVHVKPAQLRVLITLDVKLFSYFHQTSHLFSLLFRRIRHHKKRRLVPAHFCCESSEFFLFPSPLILHIDLRGLKVHLFQLANDLF